MLRLIEESFAKFLISCFAKFSSNFAKLKIKNFTKISRNYKNEHFTPTLCRSAVRGGRGGQYSPGASSALTKTVLYSSSVYTVFHSVILNSVIFIKLSSKSLLTLQLFKSRHTLAGTGENLFLCVNTTRAGQWVKFFHRVSDALTRKLTRVTSWSSSSHFY